MLLAVPKSGKFFEKFTKKIKHFFLLNGDFNFLFQIAGVYVVKSKGLKPKTPFKSKKNYK